MLQPLKTITRLTGNALPSGASRGKHAKGEGCTWGVSFWTLAIGKTTALVERNNSRAPKAAVFHSVAKRARRRREPSLGLTVVRGEPTKQGKRLRPNEAAKPPYETNPAPRPAGRLGRASGATNRDGPWRSVPGNFGHRWDLRGKRTNEGTSRTRATSSEIRGSRFKA